MKRSIAKLLAMGTHNEEGTRGQMDPADILREVYRKKWLVSAVTLLAGVAAAAVSWLMPNEYESSAALIVREPQSSIVRGAEDADSGEPGALSSKAPTLSVETLQTLSDSISTKRELYEALRDQRALGQWKEIGSTAAPPREGAHALSVDPQVSATETQSESVGKNGVSEEQTAEAQTEAPVRSTESEKSAESPAEWAESRTPMPVAIKDGFTEFQNRLSTELKSGRGRDAALLPILVLKARADSPGEAQVIANEWAKIVEAKSRQVFTEGVAALGRFIGDMYTQSDTDLKSSEEVLSKKTVEAALDLKKVRLEAVKKKCNGLEEDIFDLAADIAVNDAAIKEGTRRVAEQQYEEEWIGTVAEGAAMVARKYPFEEEGLSLQAKKIVTLVERSVRQAEQLRAYKKEQNPVGKQKEFEHYQQELSRILEEKAKADDELPSLRAALDALSTRLSTIPEKITLDKAITDDALWNAYINSALPKYEDLIPLKTEVMNPLHQSTAESAVELMAEVETLKGSFGTIGEKRGSHGFVHCRS